MKKMGVYFDTNVRRWKYKHNNTFAPDPAHKRCKAEGCDIIVRNRTGYCEKHTDWSKHAHAHSLLFDEDVVYLAEHYKEMTDIEITNALLAMPRHVKTKRNSLRDALRHHRRKFLEYRYAGKLEYYKVKVEYSKQHPVCEICGWNEAACDVHHLWQESDFDLDSRWQRHIIENMISVCPNHHRVLERLRTSDRAAYQKRILQYKPNSKVLHVQATV